MFEKIGGCCKVEFPAVGPDYALVVHTLLLIILSPVSGVGMNVIMRFSKSSCLPRFASLLFGIMATSFFSIDAAGLKDAAAKAYLNFGSCVGNDPSKLSFVNVVKNEFNILVCENAMKFASTEPSQGNFTFSAGDAVVAFAANNGMLMRGHTLVWHNQTSSWVVNDSLNRQQMLQIMKNHINGVVGHYKGKILEWDVVNEAVGDDGKSLRTSFWQQRIGNDFVDSAFVYAHQADPGAFLYYNDYGGEGMGTKANYIYAMVKGMLERGIPIHGVGLQCHFSNSVNKADISSNMKRLGALGLRVSCTEIDISNTTNNGAPWKALMEACTENFNCTSILTWGVDDAVSWRGKDCGCLIWDTLQQPKPAVYDSILSALNNSDPAIAEQRKAFITGTVDVRDANGTFVERHDGLRLSFSNDVLSYHLSGSQNVRVRVFNVRGALVADLDLGTQQPGDHTVNLHRQVPAGLYFVEIRSGNQVRHAARERVRSVG